MPKVPAEWAPGPVQVQSRGVNLVVAAKTVENSLADEAYSDTRGHRRVPRPHRIHIFNRQVRGLMNHSQTTAVLIDEYLPVYDMVLTEHLVVEADVARVFAVARDFDFMTTKAPLVTALMTLRAVPARLRGHAPAAPTQLRLARDTAALPGWTVLGQVPDAEAVFGAVGKFWNADIEWHDVPAEDFAAFAEVGWGKIACHLRVRPDGPGRSVLTYECRTATTDAASRAAMARYWWLIRPFVAYMLRAVLRTIRMNAETPA